MALSRWQVESPLERDITSRVPRPRTSAEDEDEAGNLRVEGARHVLEARNRQSVLRSANRTRLSWLRVGSTLAGRRAQKSTLLVGTSAAVTVLLSGVEPGPHILGCCAVDGDPAPSAPLRLLGDQSCLDDLIGLLRPDRVVVLPGALPPMVLRDLAERLDDTVIDLIVAGDAADDVRRLGKILR